MFQIGSHKEFLRFERASAKFPHATVTAYCNGNTLLYDYLIFDQPKQFLAELAAFERTRRGAATLTAGDEFALRIEPRGATGQAQVSYRLRRESYAAPFFKGQQPELKFETGFVLPGELVAETLRNFESFLNDEQVP